MSTAYARYDLAPEGGLCKRIGDQENVGSSLSVWDVDERVANTVMLAWRTVGERF